MNTMRFRMFCLTDKFRVDVFRLRSANFFCTTTGLLCWIIAILLWPSANLAGLSQSPVPTSVVAASTASTPVLFLAEDEKVPGGVSFRALDEQQWEMGVEISASGRVNGITAVFPLPIDWPEQKIKMVEEKKSSHVSRISLKSLGTEKSCKVAVVSIPRLAAGETARATFLIEVAKSHIIEPALTDAFRISKTAIRKQRSFLGSSPFIETTHPRIRQLAKTIPDGKNDWETVRNVFDWVRENIEYKFDEKIRTCLTALDRYQGDCEELSSLFIAICRAKRIPARAVWIPGHTYPEFYLEDQKGRGHWFPCQVAGGNNDFGRMPEDKPILQKGDRFKVPGHQKQQRYARPTLTARNAASSPTLKWILKKVE